MKERQFSKLLCENINDHCTGVRAVRIEPGRGADIGVPDIHIYTADRAWLVECKVWPASAMRGKPPEGLGLRPSQHTFAYEMSLIGRNVFLAVCAREDSEGVPPMLSLLTISDGARQRVGIRENCTVAMHIPQVSLYEYLMKF